MVIGLIGYKRGMTSVFLENSITVPVTVIEIFDNIVTQVNFCDDFIKVQMGTGTKKNLNKPTLGHFKNACLTKCSRLSSFDYPILDQFKTIKVGSLFKVDIFLNINKVDVTGLSIGKGFSGVIKRYNFHRQPASHGNSRSHRVPGSIGQRQTPGRVFKGKKMPGRSGCENVTVKNLSIISIDVDKNILLVKGSVPGHINSCLLIRQSFQEHFLQKKKV